MHRLLSHGLLGDDTAEENLKLSMRRLSAQSLSDSAMETYGRDQKQPSATYLKASSNNYDYLKQYDEQADLREQYEKTRGLNPQPKYYTTPSRCTKGGRHIVTTVTKGPDFNCVKCGRTPLDVPILGYRRGSVVDFVLQQGSTAAVTEGKHEDMAMGNESEDSERGRRAEMDYDENEEDDVESD